MKYYKNLIKRKNYFAIIISLFFTLLGIFIIFINSIEVIIDGIKESDLSAYTIINNGISGLLGSTNIGLVFVGGIVIYLGIIFTPRNAAGSQDDSDYIVESQGDQIYIKYKNREFLVKKETFEPTDLFFKDKNKKFVSMTTGYQIYNYVKMNYKELTEREINSDNVIKEEELYQKFYNVHKMSQEDKEKYLTYKKLKNKVRPFFCILTIFCALTSLFWLLGLIGFLFDPEEFNLLNIIVAIIMYWLFFVFTKKSYKATLKNKNFIKKFMKENIYYTTCTSYDKKTSTTQDPDGCVNVDYYIKVTDNHYILNKWLKVSENIYKSNETISVWLVFDETGTFILEIVGLA